jgi:hypothetical protein
MAFPGGFVTGSKVSRLGEIQQMRAVAIKGLLKDREVGSNRTAGLSEQSTGTACI